MAKKKPLTLWQRYHSFLFLSLGLLMISVSLLHFYLQRRALTLSRSEVAEYTVTQTRLPEPAKIYIQWFVDTPIESMSLVNGVWGISNDKASYLIQSARPGESGNIILYGHNTRKILGNIRALQGGETVTLTTTNGIEHQYRVSQITEVSPTQVDLLQPTQSEVLTMYTCSGFLDSMRFIVRAIPL
jgi:LPXTG-site transpeptidase (sortase) family protein